MQPAARNACPRSLIHDPVRTAGAVTGSGRFFLICFRNHGARQDGIGLDPRIANLGCEVRAETLFQRPEQRIPDRLIMLVPHPVGDVLDGKRPDCGQEIASWFFKPLTTRPSAVVSLRPCPSCRA